MNTVRANLERLQAIYLGDGKPAADGGDGGPAVEALWLVTQVEAGKSHRNLFRLLRHHSDGLISDPDTRWRDKFDECLSFYSLLEIGKACGALPKQFEESHRKQAVTFLTQPAVCKYYEERYPLLLPQAYLRRLKKNPVVPWGGLRTTHFATFFEFSETDRVEEGSALETFLWFLDGGERTDEDGAWRNLDDTLSAVAKPAKFVRCLAQTDADQVELSVQGFVEFIQFCRDFEAFLDGVRPKLLQSMFWHFFAHWFVTLRDEVGMATQKVTATKQVIRQLVKWEKPLQEGLTSSRQRSFRKAIRDYEAAVDRLCGSYYGTALRTQLSATPK